MTLLILFLDAWVCGDTCFIEAADKSQGHINLAITELHDSGLLDNFSAIVTVGTASHEGDKPVEDSRAFDRSLVLAYWLNASKKGRQIYTLNLGMYEKSEKGTHFRINGRKCDVS